MESTSGHAADIIRAVRMWPHGNDNEFCEVEIWGGANEFRERSQGWREALHDAGDRSISESFKLLEMRN